METAAAHWTLHAMNADIVHRSRRAFPHEPIRALDAIHPATALTALNLSPGLKMLSLDNRVRGNAASLGFQVAPETGWQA